MANYANLLSTIAANIKAGNGVNATTGYDVENALDQMVASLGAGYQFMGIATPATNPSTPDYKCFYIASAPGTYTNFLDSGSNPLVVNDGEVAVLKYDTAWSKDVTGAVSVAKFDDTLQELSERGILDVLFSVEGGILYADGSDSANVAYIRTPYYSVFEGQKIRYDLNVTTANWCTVACYDSNGAFVQSDSVAGTKRGLFVVPSGVSKVRFCSLKSYATRYALLESSIIHELIKEYNGDVGFDEVGGIVGADGTSSSNSDFRRTYYIPVEEGDVVKAQLFAGSSYWGLVALYDSSMNFIAQGSVVGSGSQISVEITIPKVVKYIRLSSFKSSTYYATINKVVRDNEVPAVNLVSALKYENILEQRGCLAIQMDLGNLSGINGHKEMLEVLREYGLMSMDYAIMYPVLQQAGVDWLVQKQSEGCEIIYHNIVNSPSDISEESVLTIQEAKDGVCAERLAMTQRGFTTFGLVAQNGNLGSRYKPMIDNIFAWTEYQSAQILVSGAETTKAQYLADHRVNRTGFEIIHSQYTPELEQEMITKGKEWVDTLCANKSMGVMYCHFYNSYADNYHLYENVLREMAEYIVGKINDGELYYGSTTECLNYLGR